jgi:hypothetical protein
LPNAPQYSRATDAEHALVQGTGVGFSVSQRCSSRWRNW